MPRAHDGDLRLPLDLRPVSNGEYDPRALASVAREGRPSPAAVTRSPEATTEPEAADEAVGGEEFVMDLQGHHRMEISTIE